ncbi:MAG: helix-turn-helix transcriptional regulator [Chitinophagales bacterium]
MFTNSTTTSTLSERFRKIREYRGLKQAAVAQEMNITQQAYSSLETKSGNLKIETLQRFCNVMKVDMPFLLAMDIPVTDENLRMFDNNHLSNVVDEYKKLLNRLSVYEELLMKDKMGARQAA